MIEIDARSCRPARATYTYTNFCCSTDHRCWTGTLSMRIWQPSSGECPCHCHCGQHRVQCRHSSHSYARAHYIYMRCAKGSLQLTSSVVSCYTASNGCESSSTSVSPSIRRCWRRLRRRWPAADQPEELSWGVHLRGILCFLSGELMLCLSIHMYIAHVLAVHFRTVRLFEFPIDGKHSKMLIQDI